MALQKYAAPNAAVRAASHNILLFGGVLIGNVCALQCVFDSALATWVDYIFEVSRFRGLLAYLAISFLVHSSAQQIYRVPCN